MLHYLKQLLSLLLFFLKGLLTKGVVLTKLINNISLFQVPHLENPIGRGIIPGQVEESLDRLVKSIGLLSTKDLGDRIHAGLSLGDLTIELLKHVLENIKEGPEAALVNLLELTTNKRNLGKSRGKLMNIRQSIFNIRNTSSFKHLPDITTALLSVMQQGLNGCLQARRGGKERKVGALMQHDCCYVDCVYVQLPESVKLLKADRSYSVDVAIAVLSSSSHTKSLGSFVRIQTSKGNAQHLMRIHISKGMANKPNLCLTQVAFSYKIIKLTLESAVSFRQSGELSCASRGTTNFVIRHLDSNWSHPSVIELVVD